MPEELTEDSPEVVLAAELLVAWYNDGNKEEALRIARRWPPDSAALVAAARKLAAEGRLGPVPQPEPETWEPTMRLRWSKAPAWTTTEPRRLQQLFRSSDGREEWRAVEVGQ